MEGSVEPLLVRAWVFARSIARGSPEPVAEFGGYRVETNSEVEVRRWVFPTAGDGLRRLGSDLTEPKTFLKLCGPADELRSALPVRWTLQPPGYFMQAGDRDTKLQAIGGYTIEIDRKGAVSEVRILCAEHELAASGCAAETQDAFIYDRIVTAPHHRRIGLGRAVMATLKGLKQDAGKVELLVATEAGRSLYAALGWRTISPYSTASLPKT